MAGTKSELLELLREDRERFHIEWKVHFSNHMPMALIALWRMGATKTRLHEFFHHYSKFLAPTGPPSEGRIDAMNWMSFRGQRMYFQDLVDFFHQERVRLGSMRSLFSEYMPHLLEGVGGDAFHPLILLGYGIEVADEETQLRAIAFWAYAFHGPIVQLDPNDRSRMTMEPMEILEQIDRDQAFSSAEFPASMNFAGKLAHIAGDPRLAAYDLLKVDKSTLSRLEELTIHLYRGTGDFFVLHCITALWALKVLLKETESNPLLTTAALKHFWMNTAVVYVLQVACKGGTLQSVATTVERETLEPTASQKELRSWDSILSWIVASNDAHVIKLGYVCWMTWKDTGNDAYLKAAADIAKLERI